MKKIGVLLLAALYALLPIVGMAEQEGTMIATVVPDSHTLTISCEEGGGVIVNGQRRTGTFTVEVRRLGTLTLSVDADEGWELNQVAASSGAGVEISADGSITLESVYEDKELTISFRKLPDPTPTVEPDPTPTVEPDPTPTVEPDPTPTVEPDPTPTVEPDPTPTVEPDPTPTVEPDPTPTVEPNPTPTVEPDPTPTVEPNPTPTVEPNPTPTVEPDPTPTVEPDPTPTVEPDPTPTVEPDPTATAGTEPTPTATAGTEPTLTPTATAGTEPTPTPAATAGTEPTPTPTATAGTEPTPTPTPTAGTEPTLAPTATAGTEPTPTPTATAGTEPTPTATAGTEPTLTATAGTEPTPTLTAAAEPTPTPTATAKPTPTATVSPAPTATVEPAPTVVPVEPLDNVLYDEYLGTGEGMGQLSIVFDGEYRMEDYDLLPIPEDGARMEEGVLLVCAEPDEEGLIARRSLILSALQIERLHLDRSLEGLVFQNGDMLVTADMPELCTGRVAKLIQLGLGQNLEEIDLESVPWEELPEAELTAAELEQAHVEVCISPVALEDGREGYSVQVFLRMRDELLDVSALIDSLAVNLNVTALVEENGPDWVARRVSVVAALPEETALTSRLRILPEEQGGASERFDVKVTDDMLNPIVLYSERAELRPYETIVLTAPYVGPGVYMLEESESTPEASDPIGG